MSEITEEVESPLKDDAKKRAVFIKKIAADVRYRLGLKYNGGFFYNYSEGCYYEIEREQVRSFIYLVLGKYANVNLTDNVEKTLELVCFTGGDGEFSYLNTKSGLLDLETSKEKKHTPEYFSVNQLNVKYDLKAECPLFMRFLEDIFMDEPQKILTIQEFGGYFLLGDCRFEKAMFRFGAGDNGKGQLERIEQHILGKINYSAIPLENLGLRFETRYLKDKMVNFSGEVAKGRRLPEANFKRFTSGDEMRAEHKGGAVFNYVPSAKIIANFNDPPNFANSAYSIRKRILAVPFNQKFSGKDRKLDIWKTFIPESSGILNFWITGRKRLLEQGDFTVTPQMQVLLDSFLESNSVVDSFINSECVMGDRYKTPVRFLHGGFEDFCKLNQRFKCDTMTLIAFGKALKEKYPQLESGDKCRDALGRYWKGIKFRTEDGNPDLGLDKK